MKSFEIKVYPEAVGLRKPSQPVDAVTEHERELFERMVAIMQRSSGVGLAAPQIGIPKRLFVADGGAEKGIVKIANPEIVLADGSDSMAEGCLSVPNVSVTIERASTITITGLNEVGQRVEIAAGGLFARVLQHEIDHLNGKLIIDYIDPFEDNVSSAP